MTPGTRVYSHAGPHNSRLRAHLGLLVPEKGAKLRVMDQMYSWSPGEIFIFDDSFEHEVWQEGFTDRLILIVDFLHPNYPTEAN